MSREKLNLIILRLLGFIAVSYQFFFFTHMFWFKGGAERLIVDAAVELASVGHNVHIFTAHHDQNRCFEETRAGNFLFSSIVCEVMSKQIGKNNFFIPVDYS